MKKVILLFLFLLIPLTACDKKQEEEENKVETKEEVKEEKEETKEMEEEKKETQPEESKKKTVTVPDVSNLTQEQAEQKLKQLNFKITIKKEKDSTPKGYVIKTIPASGRTVEENTEIVIYVSEGDDFIVEDYTGKNYLEVKATLESNGINVVVETKNSNLSYDQDTIIEQSVSPGKILNKGDSIKLYIPYKEATFPDFANGSYTLKDVENFCKTYDISLNIQEVPSDKKSGTILSQSRPEGSKVMGSTTLTITVAK